MNQDESGGNCRVRAAAGPGPSVLGTFGLALAICIVTWAASGGASRSGVPTGATCRAVLAWRAHSIFALAWSPDGGELAASGWGPGVRIWEVETGLARTIESADGSPRFVVGWPERAAGPTVVDLDGVAEGPGRPARAGVGAATPIEGLGLASASRGGSIRLWGPADRRPRGLPEAARGSNSVAISPDGRAVASAGRDGVVRVWGPGRGELRREWPAVSVGVNAVAWSPDGSRLASAGGGPIRVWDVATGALRATLGGPEGGFLMLAWSPDGRGLAGASWAGTIRVWDLGTGRERASLPGLGVQVLALAWSPDGSRLASGGHEATVRVWDLVAERP